MGVAVGASRSGLAVLAAGQLDESLRTGLALQRDVERALGLSEYIETLSRRLPID